MDDIITQVVFARGRILHQGTGKHVVGTARLTADEGPIVGTFLPDGVFAISGYLDFLFPQLALHPYLLHLTLSVFSPQFRSGEYTQSLLLNIPQNAQFDPDPPAIPQPPRDLGTILLLADPIQLRGQVVQARNPFTPIPNVTVEVIHTGPPASTLTGVDGRYRLDDVVLTAPAQLRCSAPTFRTITIDLLVSYLELLHEENFRLMPI